jgi:hypothetical protein
VDRPTQNLTLITAADFTSKRFYACKVDSAGKAALAGAGNNAIGIMQNDPILGEAGTVMVLGVSHAVLGGGVTAGQNLTPDAQGRLVVAGGSDAVCAIALETGTTNEVKRVCLITRTATGTVGISKANPIVCIPVTLADLNNVEVLTDYVPGFAGVIKKLSLVVGTPVTTGSKLDNVHCEVGAVATTGGVLALTSAACTPRGKVVDASAITGNNAFGVSDVLSILAATTVAPFTEGTGVIMMQLEQTA